MYKGEQLSDWDFRPLSIDQLVYASLDAHCLLSILDILFKKCNENWEGSGISDVYLSEISNIVECNLSTKSISLNNVIDSLI